MIRKDEQISAIVVVIEPDVQVTCCINTGDLAKTTHLMGLCYVAHVLNQLDTIANLNSAELLAARRDAD